MKSGYWHCGALIVTGLGMSVPPKTWAADTPPSGADSLQEVIVTASKRTERAQDVGESISVVGSTELESRHVTSLQDLTGYVPGLVITSGGSPGQTNIALRGFGSIDGPQVATLLDDFAIGSSTAYGSESAYQLDMLPYDIERIEILRGPQGTLYGADSMSGVLKYVTKYPSLTGSESQVGGELFDVKSGGTLGYGARASSSTPLIDGTLAVRASAYDQKTPGYIHNPQRAVGHENTLSQYGGRLALLWQPGVNVTVKLQGIYQKISSAGNAVVFAERLGVSTDPYYHPGAWLGGDLSYSHPVPEPFVSNLQFVSAAIDWNLRFGSLTSATGYSIKQESVAQDFSAYYGYLQQLADPTVTSTSIRFRDEVSVRRFTQEFRLASPTGQDVEWLLGTFFSHERTSDDQYLDALDSRLALVPSLTPFFVGSYDPTTYQESALFGTLTYKITPAFDVTAGLRRLTNKQTVAGNILASVQNFFGPVRHTVDHATGDATNYSLGARYHLSSTTMLYTRVASGYEPGEVNRTFANYPQIPRLTKPDSMVNYEVGVKSEFLDHRVILDLSLYKMNWSDLQINVPTPDGQVTYFINAGKVTTQGFELSAACAPTSALRMEFTAAYMDAFATEALPEIQITPGARFGLPVWTAAATIDYRLHEVDHWTPHLEASWRYIGSSFANFSSQTPLDIIPSWSTLDLSLHLWKRRVDVSVYAKNLFDKRAYSFAFQAMNNTTGATYFSGIVLQSRVIGLAASVGF
jgi:iron complex outermembrane receptor protein